VIGASAANRASERELLVRAPDAGEMDRWLTDGNAALSGAVPFEERMQAAASARGSVIMLSHSNMGSSMSGDL